MIEILLVLTIIVMVMSIGIPQISRITYQRVASTTRRFVGMMREIRNDAIFLNKIHRLALNFDDHTYWVETQDNFELLSDKMFVPPKKAEKKAGSSEVKDEKPQNFSIADKYGKGPVPLPSGVVFDGILKEREGYLKQGTAYLFFFPSGYAERGIIYLNKEGAESGGYSLLLRPATGKVDIYNGKITDLDAPEPTN